MRYAESNAEQSRVRASCSHDYGQDSSEGIHAIASVHTTPTVMNRIRWLPAVIQEDAPAKSDLTRVQGDYDHYLHNNAPEILGKAILEKP